MKYIVIHMHALTYDLDPCVCLGIESITANSISLRGFDIEDVLLHYIRIWFTSFFDNFQGIYWFDLLESIIQDVPVHIYNFHETGL